MSPTESFVDFANRIMQGNNLADKIARRRPADKERITAIEIFEDWYDEIATIDREETDDLKRIAYVADERMTKRQRIGQPRTPHDSHIANSAPQQPQFPLTGANAVGPYRP